jgi:23S rRNA pseudouridine2605 synthase
MERLQKVLAQAGIASRRAAEQIILSGRVRVDGKIVTELGTQVDPRRSRVEVDGNKIVAEKLVYIVLHKPRGVVCTLSDPEGRPTILELIKGAGTRLVPVGRLDFHTSGALLCTNDGEFAQGLAHPKKAVPKVYVAKVKGTVDDEALEHFGDRIEIDGRPTAPAQVKRLRYEGDKTWLEITLREGRNRQVRRLGEATGFPVMRLARISHAGVDSENLRPGQWRELTLDELIALKRDYGVPKKVHAPSIDYKKGIQERGEGPAARFDKRTPRTAPKKAALSPEVHGERWSRESSRDARFGRDATPRERDATPRGREAMPSRGREAMPSRGREAMPSRGREAMPSRGREAVPSRGREAVPSRGREAMPSRGRDAARAERREPSGARGKRSDGVRRDRTAAAPEPRTSSRKAPFARGGSDVRSANRQAPFARDDAADPRRSSRRAPYEANQGPGLGTSSRKGSTRGELAAARGAAKPSAGRAANHKDRVPAGAKPARSHKPKS